MSGRKPVIGITGGIGAGKSLVAEILESLGAAVIDSDRLVHEQYENAEVIATLMKWWGPSVCPDGLRVNRRAIASIVFSDPAELARLEGYLYPRIEAVRRLRMAALAKDPAIKAIVLDAPKLLEAGLGAECDVLLFVDAPEADRAARLRDARGWTLEELHRREHHQLPLDRKKALAHYIVENHSSADRLRADVEKIFCSVISGQSP